MRITISLPDTLFDEAEKVAHQLGFSRSELYAAALAAYLQEHRAGQVTRQLDVLYRDDPSRLDEVTWRLQGRSLPRDEW